MTEKRMATCEEIRDLLFSFDSLTEAEQETVERHLETCAACRKELETVESMLDDLGNLPEEQMPEMTMKRSVSVIRKQKTRASLLRYGSIAAAILLFTAGIWAAGNSILGRRMGSAAPAAGAASLDTLDKESAVPAEVAADGSVYGEDKWAEPGAFVRMEGVSYPQIMEVLPPSAEGSEEEGFISVLLTQKELEDLLKFCLEKGTVQDISISLPEPNPAAEEQKKVMIQHLVQPDSNSKEDGIQSAEWGKWIRDIYGNAEEILVEIQLDNDY